MHFYIWNKQIKRYQKVTETEYNQALKEGKKGLRSNCVLIG
jgi:hypothetical protein